MNDLKAESELFHDIASAVMYLVKNSSKDMTIVEDKGIGDYSTQVDVAVEDLIVTELDKRFPKDQVLAEEGYSNTEIPDSRIWLIDPICGTNNLGKGINNFCTNIALVDDRKVIASCVVDHSQGEFFWSVGNGEIYVNDKPYSPPSKKLGQKIDIDFGSVRSVDTNLRQKHNNYLLRLIEETDFDIISLNASLGFAYTAIGKTDGFINMFNHPWDIAAASFLIQQAGGVITGIDGSPWSIATIGAIGGHTSETHQELLNLFLNS
jgi:myo-inositol-1(or 4)-monophosphatase